MLGNVIVGAFRVNTLAVIECMYCVHDGRFDLSGCPCFSICCTSLRAEMPPECSKLFPELVQNCFRMAAELVQHINLPSKALRQEGGAIVSSDHQIYRVECDI